MITTAGHGLDGGGRAGGVRADHERAHHAGPVGGIGAGLEFREIGHAVAVAVQKGAECAEIRGECELP